MLNILLRRFARFLLPTKLLTITVALASLGYIIWQIPPGIGSILLAALLLFIVASILLNFFLSSHLSLLVSIALSFVLFLKAVNLFTPINLGLFAAFLLLLGMYLWKK